MVVAIRLIQLLLAVAILGPSAYTHLRDPDRGRHKRPGPLHDAPEFALVTVVISIWLVCAHTCSPRAYNYWATGLIFAAGTVCRSLRSSYGFCDNYKVFGGVVAGIARLGAVEFLLFFIAWVTDAVVSYRHRRSGGRARARRVAAGGSGTAPYQLQMQSRTKTDYDAVSQQGIPLNQHATAYHPQRQTVYPKAQHWAPAYGQHLRPDACASSSGGLSRACASSSPACGSLPPDLLS
ncbi:hypothetical protein H634G_05218 [Metarhizium anisopliae BRIP 53293]|uniref:MARVEL domain-containing protein n=1 Tax=Metarhizium anisopliae BRIP 53293 TaxID=1291518 RepID=A0A0D9P0M2_METAN|nr:hypothetical protein H634G_05218 [Metarhizium anisopliae BRIP 53293]KJK90635.1 hypothetical protein H633G_05543 [Metarhizium anisopliae BRIP 53284]